MCLAVKSKMRPGLVNIIIILLVYVRSYIVYCADQDTAFGSCFEILNYSNSSRYDNYGIYRPWVISISVNCSSINLPVPLPVNDTTRLDKSACDTCPKILTITHSSIHNIPPSTFVNYTSITILDMRKNGVETILPGAFNLLTLLRELYLSDNNITEISGGIFNSLMELRILDLSKNNIQHLSKHSFVGATNLGILNLSSNALQDIDSTTLLHIGRLMQLDLSFNRLPVFNFTLIANNIENLNISNNRIRNIIGCFGSITSLDMGYNLLTTVEGNTCGGNCSNIVSLDLRHNSLSNVESISTLHRLRFLALQDNSISSLPNGFFSKLGYLVVLNLSSNALDHFQYGLLDGLSSLQVLDISNNQLTDFRKFNYHLLKQLHELYIHKNKIVHFDSKEMPVVLEQLRVISLDGNKFSCDVLIEIFHDLRKIKIIGGHSHNTDNIYGITCSENDISLTSQESWDVNGTSDESFKIKLTKLFNSDFTRSSMYNYFNRDFKKSNFYQYLENLKLVGNQTLDNFEKSLNYIKNIQKSQKNFSRSVNSYFNDDFKDSNFVKYLESLKGGENLINKDFNKTAMYNYFNKDFMNSNFFKYLESLRRTGFVVKSDNGNETKFEKLVSTFTDVEEKNDTSSLLVGIIVLMIVISCVMLCFMYVIFTKFHKTLNVKNEQVELIDTELC